MNEKPRKIKIISFIICLLVIFIYLLPYYILKENVILLIHDNLDSNFIWYLILAKSGVVFGPLDAIIPNLMNGLPRASLGTEFCVILWFFMIFDPLIAYVLNFTIVHYFAFFSMFILLNRYLIKTEIDYYITLVISTLFALIPFWPFGGLSIASQPLALYSFLNFKNNKSTKWDWVRLSLIPFYSNVVLAYCFFLCMIGIIFAYDLIISKKINWKFLFSIIFMILVYLFVEYRLIYSMFFDKNYISHRVDMVPIEEPIEIALIMSKELLFEGQIHSMSIHKQIIFPIVIFGLFSIFLKSIYLKRLEEKEYFYFIIGILIIAIWYGVFNSELLHNLKDSIPLLKEFQFDRFYFLLPLMWYILFAISIRAIFSLVRLLYSKSYFKHKKYYRILIEFVFLITLTLSQSILLFQQDYNWNLKNNTSIEHSRISYKQFFAEELFKKIKMDINEPQEGYRVVCIGFHPSIAQYNGFYTLDAYISNYPKAYKDEFRRIIMVELVYSEFYRNYFDNWGSRCYVLLSHVTHYEYTKDLNGKIPWLGFDTWAFHLMGGKYIFSSLEITDPYFLTLVNLEGIYEHEDSAWRIYVYSLVF